MKNLLTTLLISFAFTVSNVALLSQYSGGKGTESDPYQIANKADMETLANSVNNGFYYSRNKYFKLMNDITDSLTKTIGYGDGMSTFEGNFNGNNKKITLAINGNDYLGLFGTARNANIYDLIIDGYVRGRYLSSTSKPPYYIGGICGEFWYGNISNCINYCKIEGLSRVGGICGCAMNVNIFNCTNYGDIEGERLIGGICGVTYDNEFNFDDYKKIFIADCINYGNIKGLDTSTYVGTYVGGIGGFIANNALSCKNYGNISGHNTVGGIAGCFATTNDLKKLSYCENSGNVSGVFAVGGISGHTHDDSEYSYCINIGTVKGDSLVGGIAGGYDNENKDKNGNIYNSINSGLVVGKHIVGGIIGRCRGTVKNCINTGTVKGNTKTGCIVGENEGGTVINCHYDTQTCGEEE